MTLTVADILHLDGMANFRLEAGIKGLDREVKAVGMLDYELGSEILKNFKPGEFVVTTLVAIKDSLEELESIVALLVEAGSSGLAIKNIYLDRLPESVTKLANQEKFPIFLFHETFFEQIITDVRDVLLANSEQEDLEWQIDQLLSGNLSASHVRRAAIGLNRSFPEHVAVAYYKPKAFVGDRHQRLKLPMNTGLIVGLQSKVMSYRGGLLFVAPSTVALQAHLEALGIGSEGYIGFSQDGFPLEQLDLAISEALHAQEHGLLTDQAQVRFELIGLNRLLLPILENPSVRRYYQQAMAPLLSYDAKQGTDLVQTAMCYMMHNGDVKSTAEALFQHSNTIRYRMDRVKTLLGPDFDWTELGVLMQLHKLYKGL